MQVKASPIGRGLPSTTWPTLATSLENVSANQEACSAVILIAGVLARSTDGAVTGTGRRRPTGSRYPRAVTPPPEQVASSPSGVPEYQPQSKNTLPAPSVVRGVAGRPRTLQTTETPAGKLVTC